VAVENSESEGSVSFSPRLDGMNGSKRPAAEINMENLIKSRLLNSLFTGDPSYFKKKWKMGFHSNNYLCPIFQKY
jgi:hypothetical protein